MPNEASEGQALTQPPLQVATRLVNQDFDACLAAFLAGSVVRQEHTSTSDLDIVIVTDVDAAAPYRRSVIRGGWPVELFVHTPASLQRFFAMDCADGTPSLPQMCSEGLIITQQADWGDRLKADAARLLATGPAPLSPEQILHRRYRISDLLEDLRGSQRPEESLFIAPELVEAAFSLYLAYHGHWQGHGKWLHRSLKKADPELAERLIEALHRLYCDQVSLPLIQLVEALLVPLGGPYFDGFYAQAPQ